MLLHSCVTVSSKENALLFFEKVFGFKMLYSFDISPEIIQALFNVNVDLPVHAIKYDMGNSCLEVFILSEMPEPGVFQHICIEFNDRNEVIKRAEGAGMQIRRYKRSDTEVVFAVDTDNNLYELKTGGKS